MHRGLSGIVFHYTHAQVAPDSVIEIMTDPRTPGSWKASALASAISRSDSRGTSARHPDVPCLYFHRARNASTPYARAGITSSFACLVVPVPAAERHEGAAPPRPVPGRWTEGEDEAGRGKIETEA